MFKGRRCRSCSRSRSSKQWSLYHQSLSKIRCLDQRNSQKAVKLVPTEPLLVFVSATFLQSIILAFVVVYDSTKFHRFSKTKLGICSVTISTCFFCELSPSWADLLHRGQQIIQKIEMAFRMTRLFWNCPSNSETLDRWTRWWVHKILQKNNNLHLPLINFTSYVSFFVWIRNSISL